MLNIEHPGPPITTADVIALEEYLGTALPHDYRRFLLRNNGGRPTPDTIFVSANDTAPLEEAPPYGIPGNTDVSVFFGIDRQPESSDIYTILDTFAERLNVLSESVLPIGSDSAGNLFCIMLVGLNRGAVFYCDLQSVFADYGTPPHLYFVSPSFNDMLASLKTVEA